MRRISGTWLSCLCRRGFPCSRQMKMCRVWFPRPGAHKVLRHVHEFNDAAVGFQCSSLSPQLLSPDRLLGHQALSRCLHHRPGLSFCVMTYHSTTIALLMSISTDIIYSKISIPILLLFVLFIQSWQAISRSACSEIPPGASPTVHSVQVRCIGGLKISKCCGSRSLSEP